MTTIFLDENNWQEKKLQSLEIGNSFLRIAHNSSTKFEQDKYIYRHNAINNCSNYLEFSLKTTGEKKLKNANFCRLRLCPMCTWRRSKKIFSQVSSIMDELKKDESKAFIFLTLTVKNIDGNNLKLELKNILKSFKIMMDKSKEIKAISKGYFRALEVTRNKKTGQYHPHLHIIICVDKSYFKSTDYITTRHFSEIWRKYAKTDYNPVVYVEKISNDYKSVAEVAKYSVKFNNIILKTEKETDKNIKTISSALHGVRLIGMGGIFKELHKKLNLEDLNGDNINLINTDNETNAETTELIIRYNWSVGYSNYILEKR